MDADHLLEDLQASVSRPGSSLGQPIHQNYSTSSRDVQYLSPMNSTTIVRERSLSPSLANRTASVRQNYLYLGQY